MPKLFLKNQKKAELSFIYRRPKAGWQRKTKVEHVTDQ